MGVSCTAGRVFTTEPQGKPMLYMKSESLSVLSNSLQPHGLSSLWNSPGQNTGVGSLSVLQGDLPYPGIEPTLQVASLPAEPKGEAQEYWSG